MWLSQNAILFTVVFYVANFHLYNCSTGNTTVPSNFTGTSTVPGVIASSDSISPTSAIGNQVSPVTNVEPSPTNGNWATSKANGGTPGNITPTSKSTITTDSSRTVPTTPKPTDEVTDFASIKRILKKCEDDSLTLNCSNKVQCCRGYGNTSITVGLGDEENKKCTIKIDNKIVKTTCLGDMVKICTCAAPTLTISFLVFAVTFLFHFYH